MNGPDRGAAGSGAALDAHIVVRHRIARPTRAERGDGFAVRARLQAAPGEVVAVVGPSGAGKSTILAAIAGALPIAEGTITIGDRVVSSPRVHVPPARRGVVLLDQDARLFPHLDAAANVAFGLRARGLAKTAARDAAHAWLDRVGLHRLGDRSPARLSGGQQQRVALARALAVAPALVLLDEPFGQLDVATAASVRDVVQEQLAATGATAVVVTHDAEDAAALADSIVVVEGGRIAQSGPLLPTLELPATPFAAAFADLNRVEGHVRAGVWSSAGTVSLDARGARATMADGPATAVFRPMDVRVERTSPTVPGHGSGGAEAGSGIGVVRSVRRLPAGARIVAHAAGTSGADAPGISADVDAARAAELGLRVGDAVRLTIDPDRVRFADAARRFDAPPRDARA